MEARITRAVLLAAVLLVSMGAGYRTPNFIIQTQDPQFAAQVGQAAETYRRELAISWLGKAMPDWSRPCPVTVQDGPHLGAGGATTFVFDRGEVFGWRMTIQGSRERLLDSVLPHEITHMIFASHFRQPLPRWADEGGATTVEHASEKAKHKRMLVEFLQTGRGIAFNQMFAMKEYPQDIMPLYAQGYSLAELLIQQQGGRPKYIAFLGEGLRDNQWSAALQRHYGIADVGVLQTTWVAWVAQGFPAPTPPAAQPEKTAPETLLAAAGKRARPAPNLIHRVAGPKATPAAVTVAAVAEPYRPGSIGLVRGMAAAAPTSPSTGAVAQASSIPGTSPSRFATAEVLPAGGWHAAGTLGSPDSSAVASAAQASPAEPDRNQVSRPQPVEKARQIILQWGRPDPRLPLVRIPD